MVDVGSRLKELRKSKHLTLRQVAESTNISRSNLSEVENNEHGINATNLNTLANFYGVTTDYLLGKTSKPNAIQITYADADGVVTNLEYELIERTKGFDVEDFHKVLEYIDFIKTVKEKESDNDEKPS